MSVQIDSHFFRSLYCTTCGYHFLAPIYCENRFCQICSSRRTAEIRQRLRTHLKSLRFSPGYGIKFLTLTIPPQDTPANTARLLITCFRRLRKRALWRDNVLAGAYVLEATRRPHGFHLHLHAVLEAKYIPWQSLHQLWVSLSPGRGVFVQRIPHNAAINYLTKYLTKSSLSYDDQLELSNDLKDFRLFQLFGKWHNCLPKAPSTVLLCPDCGGSHWMPDYEIDSGFRQLADSRRGKPSSRSP